MAYESSVTRDALTGRPWVLFERKMHPPAYDSVMRLAQERKIAPASLYHIVVPEDEYPFIAHNGGVTIVVKSSTIRMAVAGGATGRRRGNSGGLAPWRPSCSNVTLCCVAFTKEAEC